MSWLSNFAGKAENLLNNIDHAAGQIITKTSDDKIFNNSEPVGISINQHHAMTTSTSVPANMYAMDGKSSPYLTQLSRSNYSPSQSLDGKSKRKTKDDELFEFLNDKNSQIKHSRNASVSSKTSAISGKINEEIEPNENFSVTSKHSNKVDDVVIPINDTTTVSNTVDDSHQFQLENKLLKNEISSLNSEMNSLLKKFKNSDEESKRLKLELQSLNHKIAESEKFVNKSKTEISDFDESLSAKDSQIAVLKVRYEEAQNELSLRNEKISEMQQEYSKAIHEHKSVNDVQSKSSEDLKNNVENLQLLIEKERSEFRNKENEYIDKIAKLENDYQVICESLTSAQRTFDAEQLKINENKEQVKNAKIELETVQRELIEYKEKASRILQAKERLIDTLKSGENNESDVVNIEIMNFKSENEFLKEELKKMNFNADDLRSQLHDMDNMMANDSEEANKRLIRCQKELDLEKNKVWNLENEIKNEKRQIDMANEEMWKLKNNYQLELKERNVETEKLRSQLLSKPAANESEIELENRLHNLTESLIHKQTMVEALSTEKNSLCLQLERLELQYNQLKSNNHHASSINTFDDEIRNRMPILIHESATDGDVTRRVKRAANSVDRFSVRMGTFLRRYPIARILVIGYIFLLHLWVMLVLFTYQPELHGSQGAPFAPNKK